jgi:hypothetical protein
MQKFTITIFIHFIQYMETICKSRERLFHPHNRTSASSNTPSRILLVPLNDRRDLSRNSPLVCFSRSAPIGVVGAGVASSTTPPVVVALLALPRFLSLVLFYSW